MRYLIGFAVGVAAAVVGTWAYVVRLFRDFG